MPIPLARRMSKLKASEIREILKLTENPEVISFAGGLPAPEYFPVQGMKAAAVKVLDEEGSCALQYSTTEGFLPLRQKIADRMNATLATRVSADEILVTNGSQQGLDLTGKVFLDEGDIVFHESPTYLGAIHALRAYEPRFIEVPTDDDGMIPHKLERLLANHVRAKLIYVNTDFQNPTGRTWSLDRRKRFMEVVDRHGILVVEDNPYGELRYEGSPLPSLKSLDRSGLVLYTGTFSKVLCPGLRIGWVAAPRQWLDQYVLVKQGADLHSSTLSQRQIAAYLERFDLDADLRRIRDAYRRRRDMMVQAISSEFPPVVRFTRPAGGLFLWVELPDCIDARDLLRRSLGRGVAFVPGGSFFPDGERENTLRLNFSNMPEDRIAEGIRRLGAVLREMLDRPFRR